MFMVLGNFLFGNANLDYFNQSIFIEDKLGSMEDKVQYNIAVVYKNSKSTNRSECGIDYTLIPFFINKDSKKY